MRLLVLATTTLAANVRWPPQLNEEDAGVIVRGRAVSVVSQRGCFSVDGRPCAAAVPRAGDDDDGALSPPAVAAAAPLQAVDADLLVVMMEANCAGHGGLWFFARYTKGYYGKIFLDRGPRQERSTLDAAQAARTVRCASEASAGPRAKRPSCDK